MVEQRTFHMIDAGGDTKRRRPVPAPEPPSARAGISRPKLERST